jgi:hypothetical protein
MYRYDDEEKRPAAIKIPPFPLPPSRPLLAREQQREARKASNSTRHRSNGSTPLTTPVEPTETVFPPVGSGRSRRATFTIPVDENARGSSPRRSDHGSTADSHGNASTARSRQSGRSHRSATTTQALLEVLDEKTVRGKIESKNEKNLFKMTGQIPPTPTGNTTMICV